MTRADNVTELRRLLGMLFPSGQYGSATIDKIVSLIDTLGSEAITDASLQKEDIKAGATESLKKVSGQAVVVGPADVYGAGVTISPISGYNRLKPEYVAIVYGGTFDTETVTVQITATYDDDTTAAITDTKNATGTNVLTLAELFALFTTGKTIKSLVLKAKTDHADPTAATVAVDLLAPCQV